MTLQAGKRAWSPVSNCSMCVTSRGEVALQLSTHFITRPQQLSTCCPICPTSLPACAVHSQHQPYPTGMHPVAVGGRWPDKGHTVAVQCWCLLVAVATCDTAAEQLRGCSVRRHARCFFPKATRAMWLRRLIRCSVKWLHGTVAGDPTLPKWEQACGACCWWQCQHMC